jgi:hypothetical protein
MYGINDMYSSRLLSLPQQLKSIIKEFKFEINKGDVSNINDIVTIENQLKWAAQNKWIVRLYNKKNMISCHECENYMQIDTCSRDTEDEMFKIISELLDADILIMHNESYLYLKNIL